MNLRSLALAVAASSFLSLPLAVQALENPFKNANSIPQNIIRHVVVTVDHAFTLIAENIRIRPIATIRPMEVHLGE